jgi:hypothetical protein
LLCLIDGLARGCFRLDDKNGAVAETGESQ